MNADDHRSKTASPGGRARGAPSLDLAAAGQRGRAPWIALVTLAVVLAGLALAYGLRRAPVPAPTSPPVATPADTSDAVIGQALAQAPVDSAEIKNRWMDEIQGLDVSMLTRAQRARLVAVANTRRCTCGCGFTLAACRAFDTTCPVSGPRVEALRDSVRAGRIPARGLRARPGSAGPPTS